MKHAVIVICDSLRADLITPLYAPFLNDLGSQRAGPARLRDNLAAVGRDTALYKQTLDNLGETEASITTLSTHIDTAAAEIERLRNSCNRWDDE